MVFTALAVVLLGVPGLQAIGGFLLFYLAFKLIRPQESRHGEVKEASSLKDAVLTIVLADVVMSLDNILAVGGAANGQFGLMIFGLVLSIPIILFGSELVARLLGRFPPFLYIGVFVLVHAAVEMILQDPWIPDSVNTTTLPGLLMSLLITGAIVGVARLLERSRLRRERAAPASAQREREEKAGVSI